MAQSTAQTICKDLLYLIFLHALPCKVHADASRLDITAIEPMNFSMVCRSWRAVVLSFPNLWGHIWITNIGFTFAPAPASLDHFLSKWLQYSQTSRLSIMYQLRYLYDEEEVLANVIDTTVAQYFRLENVTMDLENPEPFTLQMSPTLVSFTLVVVRYPELPLGFSASLDFTSCAVMAKLRKLYVSDGVRWILPKRPGQSLRFPILRELDISTSLNGNIDDMHAVLVACPNIEVLTVYARRCLQHDSSTSSTSTHTSSIGGAIFLPHLTRLDITSANRSATMMILGWLMCPSLDTLIVDALEDQSDSDNLEEHRLTSKLLITCQEFLGRSRPPISYLRLDYPSTSSTCPGHGQALRNMLRPLRTLKDLTLHGVVVDNELFEDMTLHEADTSGDSTVCPFLTRIKISFRNPTTLSFSVQQSIVEEMIRSRREPTRVLESIELILPGFRYEDGGRE